MTDTERSPLFLAAKEAFIFLLPLLNMESFRRRCMESTPSNVFSHGRDLYDHTNRIVTTPNNDTLYSFGWLDLRDGPVTVTKPATEDRYVSLAFLDMYTNNFVVLSDRTSGPEGGVFTVVGPDASSEGLQESVIRSPTSLCLAFIRVLVYGQEDLPAAQAIQDQFSIQGPANSVAVPGSIDVDWHSGWRDFFSEAARLFAFHRPRVTDLAAVHRMAPLGLDSFDPGRFDISEVAEIEAGMEAGRKAFTDGMVSNQRRQGWLAPPPSQGDFGQDYMRRAGVSVFGLLALPWEESTCFNGYVFDSQQLDGRVPMVWHLPSKDTIAVDAFWSLTMYETTADGERYFTENPLNRYAIGDRTPGLRSNPDGSIDIWLSHESPGNEKTSNWLPAPNGPYCLILRCYLPRTEFHADNYSQLPQLKRVASRRTTD